MSNATWRQRWLPLIAVGGIAIALALVIRPFHGSPFHGSPFHGSPFHGSPSLIGSPSVIAEPGPSQPIRIAIVCWGDPTDPGYCARYGADQGQRGRLTDAQRAEATALANPIVEAVYALSQQHSGCVPGSPRPNGDPPPCRLVYDPIAPDDVLAAIARPDAIVRPARYSDPAPVGSIFYAVPLASACLIGHTGSMGAQHTIVGPLPGGHCALPPP